MFERYAAGTTTLNQLAAWLNEEGFRTRNTRKMSNPDGSITKGPRLFTNASVRVILHNPFYAGLVKHRGELYPGAHEPVVSIEMFDVVQDKLRQNSGRSMTLTARPERQYLLKGIIRCAYCLMPMWSQTYRSGGRYYREHRGSRGHAICPASGGSIGCEVADQQVGKIVEAIELGPRWEEEVLSIVSTRDEAESIRDKRQKVQERLRRLGKVYLEGVLDDGEYDRQKRVSELELESLVVPEADAASSAGKLICELLRLWADANLEERRHPPWGPSCAANRVQLSTDGYGAYLDAVEGAFGGNIDYAQLIKVYGQPSDEDRRRYSPAQCLSVRKREISGAPNMAELNTRHPVRE